MHDDDAEGTGAQELRGHLRWVHELNPGDDNDDDDGDMYLFDPIVSKLSSHCLHQHK